MRLRIKVLAFFAAAMMMLGIAGPALADSPTETTPEITITPGTQFSVEITHATDFASLQFNLTDFLQWNTSASYDFKVTDLRGTGQGWTVNVSSTQFTEKTTLAVVPGATMYTANNTAWATFITPNAGGFTPGTGAISAGVSYTSNSSNIIGAGRVVLQSASGVVGVTPNGTGDFSDEEVLYIDFPAAVAAGTYEATVTLTLTSVVP